MADQAKNPEVKLEFTSCLNQRSRWIFIIFFFRGTITYHLYACKRLFCISARLWWYLFSLYLRLLSGILINYNKSFMVGMPSFIRLVSQFFTSLTFNMPKVSFGFPLLFSLFFYSVYNISILLLFLFGFCSVVVVLFSKSVKVNLSCYMLMLF